MVFSCDGMNELHEKYLDGEVVYIGKPKDITSKPGKNRIRLCFKNSTDPKISTTIIKYNFGKDSLLYNYDGAEKKDSVEVIINNLEEKTYVFELTNINKDGTLKSIPVEISEKSYGDKYESYLKNRLITSYTSYKDSIILNWGEAPDGTLSTNLEYISTNGATKSLVVANEITSSVIKDYKLNTDIKVNSAYKPTESAIDEFKSKNGITKIPFFMIDPNSVTVETLPNDKEFKAWEGDVSYLFDGIISGNNFLHGDATSVLPATITYDMGAAYTLKKMISYARTGFNDRLPSNFDVWVSDSPSPTTTVDCSTTEWETEMTTKGWSKIYEFSSQENNGSSITHEFTSNTISGRYLRIRLNDIFTGDKENMNISELKLFGIN
jgi:hypothetical protein